MLVGVSAWAMPILGAHDKAEWSGRVFAGVGVGVAFAGLLGLAASVDGWNSRACWLALGAVALVLAALLWQPLAIDSHRPVSGSQARARLPYRVFVVAACYGVFGYGYIIPATFLPAQARSYIDDPVVFGLICYINFEYMSPFFTPDPTGLFGLGLMQVVGIGGMCWMGIGAFIMSQMINFEI